MIIKNVHISGFGQFHNRDFSFGSGINIITGHNESGKSTLNNFITHMLYGMSRSRGKASRVDNYSKYCPWNYPDSFGGSMRVEADGVNYLIERSFSSSGKTFTITNEATGEQTDANEALLNYLTGGISENAFRCTLNIKESGLSGSSDMSELIKKHILNIGCTSSVNINAPAAIKSLNDRKKELTSEINQDARRAYYEAEDRLALLNAKLDRKRIEIAELPSYEDSQAGELEQQNNLLGAETGRLQLEYSELKSNLESQGFNSQSDIIAVHAAYKDLYDMTDTGQNSVRLGSVTPEIADNKSAIRNILSGSIFAMCLIGAAAGFILNYQTVCFAFAIAAALSGVFTIISIIVSLVKRRRSRRITKLVSTPAAEVQESLKKLSELYGKYIGRYETSEENRIVFTNYIANIKNKFIRLEELANQINNNTKALSENMETLLTIKNSTAGNAKLHWESDNLLQQIDSLEEEKNRLTLVLNENQKLKQEIEALELAINTIKDISANMHTEHAPELNKKVSKTFNRITQTDYGELFISENMNITLNDGIRTIPIENLSQGTIEQIYMSLRLSAADMLFGEKEFPIIMDEAFSKYDNPRLAQTLKSVYLNHKGQTFIFSCQNRERLILEKLGIPFNYIKL